MSREQANRVAWSTHPFLLVCPATTTNVTVTCLTPAFRSLLARLSDGQQRERARHEQYASHHRHRRHPLGSGVRPCGAVGAVVLCGRGRCRSRFLVRSGRHVLRIVSETAHTHAAPAADQRPTDGTPTRPGTRTPSTRTTMKHACSKRTQHVYSSRAHTSSPSLHRASLIAPLYLTLLPSLS